MSEEGKVIKVYMGIPSMGTRSDIQCYALRELERKLKGKVEFVYPELYCQRIFHDFARNEVALDFLNSGCDVLWFLDSDVSPNPKMYELFTEHYDKWDLAGAPYPVFITPPGHDGPQVLYTVYKMGPNGLFAAPIPNEGIDMVDGIATGCLFIKRSVFDKLEKPYFEFKYEPETRKMIEGEDLGFCLKVNKLGYKFFVDYSMLCKHFKNVDLLEVNNYAVSYANKAVNAYDKMLRSSIAKKRLGLDERPSGIILPKF